jgi:hypothetical protein
VAHFFKGHSLKMSIVWRTHATFLKIYGFLVIKSSVAHRIMRPFLYTLKEPRNRFRGIDSARLGIDSRAP